MAVRQVWIPGGEFAIGSNDHYRDEGPVQRVTVAGFDMDAHPVTNAEFAEFIEATGHLTVAEVAPQADLYPGARHEDLGPGSLVFTMTAGPVNLSDYRNWWTWCHGADWRHPTGPDSTLADIDDHPVVHVAYPDAVAYAAWVGRELPSEPEWEFAARGGLDGAEFVWGNEDRQETAPRANTWQGRFPFENTELDGWTRTSPVGFYEPNAYGLYDMAGNVWEWTNDWYTEPSRQRVEPLCCAPERGSVVTAQDSLDKNMPGTPIPRKVLKGGSHLCTIQYCFRYRPAARQPQMIDTSASHIGFRCVSRVNTATRGLSGQDTPG